MERHRHSSQTFFPLDVARYVVIVAPRGAHEKPDMSRARAFLVPGDTTITYAADCWHHPMIALDRPACFSVLMWRDGTPNDMDIVTLDPAVRAHRRAAIDGRRRVGYGRIGVCGR